MANLQELISLQEQKAIELEKAIANVKKAPLDRRSLDFYQKRSEELSNLWLEFERVENVIRRDQTLSYNDPYIVNNLHQLLGAKYREALDNIDSQIKRIKEATMQPPEVSKASEPLPSMQRSDEGATVHHSGLVKLMRRQSAMMSSLERMLEDESAHTDAIAATRLWQPIEDIHFQMSEMSESLTTQGYDITRYIQLEGRVRKLAKATDNMPATPTNISLPKVIIPKFAGDYEKWPTFSDLFQKVVHEQPISAVQKMWYLKTHLTGEAERLIRHLALTEYNYTTAWNTLKERFNNKRVLTSTIIEQILSHQCITSEANSIKGLHDVIQESLAALTNLNVRVQDWDPLLLQILIKKLDRNTHILYESSITTPREVQTIDHFLRFLEQRFQALESLGQKERPKKVENQNSPKMTTTASLLSTACKGCDAKDHAIYYCKNFIQMTPKERYQWVQDKKLCINCLKPGHKAETCISRTCKHCTKKHNSLLHFDCKPKPQIQKKGVTQTSPASAPAIATNNAQPASSSTNSVVATTNQGVENNQTHQNYVLLATAKVRIVANNGQACEGRAVLDAGSQVSLISQRLINKLSLSTKKKQNYSLKE